MSIKQRVKTLLDRLNTGIYEKEEVMALALLSSIAGESIFLLGPPGVAKSLIARRLKYAYKDAKVFEYLMSRFSTPDEIFGPVAISKLKSDKYERVVENYLPSADVVFLDEIWKAGPSIQNALLTILNEKIFRNGEKEIHVPMKALISASNELPAKDQGLEALWDRFLIRLIVEGIKDRNEFDKMIAMPSALFEEKNVDWSIVDKEYEDWSKKIDWITTPENIFNIIHVIRRKIEQYNNTNENTEEQIYVSDRRWRKILRLLRASALLNGRTYVDLMDCFLIKHCIWNEESQIQAVSGFVNESIRDFGPNLDMDLDVEREEFARVKTEIEKNTSMEVVKFKQSTDSNNINYYGLTPSYYNKYYLIQSDKVDNANNNYTPIKIFSDKFAESIDCNITKAAEEYSVNVSGQTYQLQTYLVMEPYKKSPTRGDFEIWNKETENLLSILGEKKKDTNHFWETYSESFYDNIFVDKSYADIFIKIKIDAVIKEIEKFVIDIEAIRKKYQDIYEPNE